MTQEILRENLQERALTRLKEIDRLRGYIANYHHQDDTFTKEETFRKLEQQEIEFRLLLSLLGVASEEITRTLSLMRDHAEGELDENGYKWMEEINQWLGGGPLPSWYNLPAWNPVETTQTYHFYSNEWSSKPVKQAYELRNRFLRELAQHHIVVKPENLADNTKTYVDQGSTATVASVVLTFHGDSVEQATQIERVEAIQTAIVAPPSTTPASNSGDGFDPFLDSDDLP